MKEFLVIALIVFCVATCTDRCKSPDDHQTIVPKTTNSTENSPYLYPQRPFSMPTNGFGFSDDEDDE